MLNLRGGASWKFDNYDDCLCSRQRRDNLFHILLGCPCYTHLCERPMPEFFVRADDVDGLMCVLSSDRNIIVEKLVKLLIQILRKRLLFKSQNF